MVFSRHERVPGKENASKVGSNETSSDEYNPEVMRKSKPDYNESDDDAKNNKEYSTNEIKDDEVEVTSQLHELAISATFKSMKDNNREREHKVKEDKDLSDKIGFSSRTENSKEISFDQNEKESFKKIQTDKDVLMKEESARNAKEIFLNTIKDTLIQWFTDSTYEYLNMVSPSYGNIETLEDNSGAKQGG